MTRFWKYIQNSDNHGRWN